MKRPTRTSPPGPPGETAFRLMWALFGLAILIPVLLSFGWLRAVQGWLFGAMVVALFAFLIVGTIWERRSGAFDRTKRPWLIREKWHVYITALIVGAAVGVLYVISLQHLSLAHLAVQKLSPVCLAARGT